jgi:RecB family exonuclease
MAEHLRHALARSGFAVRSSIPGIRASGACAVGTLARLLDDWGLPPAAPRSLIHILLEEELDRLRPARFERVREFRGLHAELARLLEEVPEPDECEDDLGRLLVQVESRLTRLGFALRSRRLREAAEKLRTGEVVPPAQTVFDGFFTLGTAELNFVAALGERSSATVTLPAADPRLVALGFAVETLTGPLRSAQRQVFTTATPEREVEEIARRILAHSAKGRRFREMGVVLRSREPYGSLVETTLQRFGIPARAYFLDPLGSHPAVAYLAGVVRALLDGWDHAALNALLRMPVSGVGATREGDRFDFILREALPGRGLPIPGIKAAPAAIAEFQRLSAWRRERQEPVEWAARLGTLSTMVARPLLEFEPALEDERAAGDLPDREQVRAWRSTAAATTKFREVVEQLAGFAGTGMVTLERFWKHVETALAVEVLPLEDQRRDVVPIMDVYEARQWELPVVFVCGLLERAFPRYHGENPVLGDTARQRLGLPTSTDLQAEERLLFEVAATRAREQVVLSYPRFDERGEETLPSFFLSGFEGDAVQIRVRPEPARGAMPALLGPVRISANKHQRLSATSIEDFLQCPFKFFARKTLKLQERPAAPRDRLSLLVQGTILHRALAEWWRAPLLGVGVLDQVFEMECAQKRVPRTYRTEAVRLELLRHFENFLKDPQLEPGWDVRVEEEFEFELRDGLRIRGRIDRLEIEKRLEADAGRRALVIDYKYSGNVKSRVEDNESGSLVQGGLYLLAAERAFGLDPIGMFYCALKGKVSWDGWHAPVTGLERRGESCGLAQIRELMDRAELKAVETREAILAGRVEARPADPKKCDWCEYRDICRVETLAKEQRSGAGG